MSSLKCRQQSLLILAWWLMASTCSSHNTNQHSSLLHPRRPLRNWLFKTNREKQRVLPIPGVSSLQARIEQEVYNIATTTEDRQVSDEKEQEEEEPVEDVRDRGMRLPLTPWQQLSRTKPSDSKQQQEEESQPLVEAESVPSTLHGTNETDHEEPPEKEAVETRSEALDIIPTVADEDDSESNDADDEQISLNFDALTSQPVTPLLALPTSLSLGTLKTSFKALLKNPNLPKWGITGLQLAVAFYLLNGVWRAATEVMDEFQAELGRESSPHLLKVDEVRQIVNELLQPEKASSFLQQQPTLHHLAHTLLASGMPLQSDDETSVEQILLSLTRAEANILQQCLWTPSKNSPTSFADISGLHSIKQSLLDLVWNLKNIHGRKNKQKTNPFAHVVEQPPGVLLFGPPGCGKTLLVKALASAAQLPCLVVTPSVLLSKYVGETNLQVRALFSLAQKLSPCILCIDELDGLFRERSSTEHDVSRDLKTEFLQWWDGISSRGNILVVGSTNRPFEVDSAVLRRMPQSYFVGLPNYEARRHMLSTLLGTIPVSSDVELHPLAADTEGYTPSDLKQIVRMAVTMGPLREARFSQEYRPLTMKDVGQARSMVSPTPLTPGYRAALIDYAQRNSGQVNHQNSNHPWDSFYNAGTIHATEHGILPDWSERGDDDEDDDDEYYDDQDSESDDL